MRKQDAMLDIDMAAVAAGVTDALAGGREPWKPAVGDMVIYWAWPAPIAYGGLGQHGGEQLVFGTRKEVLCDPSRVAPADAPLPDPKDPRLDVAKSKRPYSYLPGDWRLTLPGLVTTWHKTKRDATAEGLRRLAILDWHASQAKASQENAEVPALAG